MGRIAQSIQFIVLLALGFVLVYFSVQKLDLNNLWITIKQGNFLITIPIFTISIFGYWVRSLRWKILLNSMDETPKVSYLFASLSMGYAVNFATPRMGEIVRCVVLNKFSHIALNKTAISVVAERVIDVVCLAIIVLIASAIKIGDSNSFIDQLIIKPIIYSIQSISWLWLVISIIIVGMLGVFVIRKVYHNAKLLLLFNQFLQAIKGVLFLKKRSLFFAYTLGIWMCYFLMTYLWFYTFDVTKTLTLQHAFIVMAVGSIGRSVPLQGGGMGAYHFLVSNIFVIFGVSLLMGNAMAFIIHGAQMALTLVLGISCWLWMLLTLKLKQKQ